MPVAILISSLALVHYLFLLRTSHGELVCFIPDGAFYEVQLARHFLATRSFSTTTGFRLLNTYR